MRKNTEVKLILSSILVLMLVFAMPLAAFAEANFLNPDFREWDTDIPNDWSFVSPDLDSAYIMQTEEGFMLDVYDSYAYIMQPIELEQQTTYKISFEVLTENMEESQAGVQAAFFNQVAATDLLQDTNGEYKTVLLYVKTNVDAEQTYLFRLGIGLEEYYSTGTAYFRNLKIEPQEEMPEDYIVYTLIGSIGIDNNYFEEEAGEVIIENNTPENTETANVTYNSVGVALCAALVSIVIYLLYTGRHAEKLSSILKKNSCVYVLFALALLIRLVIALTEEGHVSDLNCFKAWASTVYSNGMETFYTSGMFADYPPAYMYVLYVIGFIRDLFQLDYNSKTFELLVRLPAILCDLALAYTAFRFAEKKFNRNTGIMLALFLLFSPVFILDSANWGQVDSVLILAMTGTLYYLYIDKKVKCAALYTVCVLIKPQAALIAPLIIAIYIRDLTKNDTWKKTLKEILLSAVAVVAVYTVLSLPFKSDMGYLYVFERMLTTVGGYPYASVNAFNLFSLFGANFKSYYDVFFILDYKTWGMILIGLTAALAVYLTVCEKGSNKGIWLGAAITFIGIFFLGHGMHERYILPSIVFLMIAAIEYGSRRLLLSSVLLQSVSFLNVYYVLIYKATWIPDYVIIPIGIAYALYFIYSMYSILSAGRKEKSIEITETDSPSFMERAIAAAKERFEDIELNPARKMKKKDYIFMLIITAVYAIVAFTNLGGTNIPDESPVLYEGDSYIIELEDSSYIEKLEYYAGYCEGDFAVYLSDDGKNYENKGQTSYVDHNYSDMFTWQFVDIYEHAKYVKLVVSRGYMEIREVGLWNEEPGMLRIVASETITQNETVSDAAFIFDEQNEVDYVTDYMDEMYFDEIYHARTAYEYIHGIYPYEITHPPFGKSILSLGIQIFGMNPFGWRFMGALFGVLILPVFYVLSKRIFRRTKWAAASTTLFAADFMHYSLTRIATIDSYSIFFILMMTYFMYEYMQHNFLKEKLGTTLIPLGLCGLMWGLGCSTKWLCVYAGVGLAIAFFYTVYQRSVELKYALSLGNESMKKEFVKKLSITIAFCVLVFVIIPVIIYCVSYIPYFNADEYFGLRGIWYNQEYMLNYHGHSVGEANHPFNSKVWTWPFDIRPVFFFMSNNIDPAYIAVIACFGNPILWWSGVIAMMFLIGVRAKGKLDFGSMPYISLMGLSQIVPWMIIKREVYIYHYFATLPFIILAIVYVLRYLEENFKWGKKAVYAYIGIVVLAFILFYPMITGIVVPEWYSNIFRWLDTWPFYCV